MVVNQSALNALPQNPWFFSDNGTFILDPSISLCIGPQTACLSQTGTPGTTQILTPIQIYNNWLLDTTAYGLRLSFINSSIDTTILPSATYLSQLIPIIHATNNGGIVIGPDPARAVANILTLVGTPVNYVIAGMWASTSSIAFVNPSGTVPTFIDTVCHVLNASICGTLLRNSPDDSGLFWSTQRIIYGPVDYGVIVANLDAYVIFNGSMVIVDYQDTGAAQPCMQNPTGEPPASSNLWLDVFLGTSCTVYRNHITVAIPQNACFQLSSTPPQIATLVGANSSMFAMATVTPANINVTITPYSDSACTLPLGGSTTANMGCTPGTITSFYFSLQLP